MKISAVIIVHLALFGSVLSFRNLQILNDISRECLERLPSSRNDYRTDLYRPVGYTLESFISLMEKIEHKHPRSNVFEITNMLLERFYFSELTQKKIGNGIALIRDLNKKHRADLLKKMLEPLPSNIDPVKFFEEDFTSDERCSLYFMIGHNINDTFRGPDFDFLSERAPSDPASVDAQGDARARSKFPREQGLVSLHSDSINAVAMGRVLVGIAAGERKGETKTLYQLNSEATDDHVKDLQVECLGALTIGDAVAYTEMQDSNGQKYGPPGQWNSTSCQIEYKLTSDKIKTTDAEMRGSIDGYILGYYINDLRRDHGDALTLSRLIRMYYSKHGIRVGTGSTKIGFCERSNVIGALDENTLKTTVTNVINLYHVGSSAVGSEDVGKMNWYSDYSRYVTSHAIERPTRNICQQPLTTIDKKFPETPVDVFFVLDVTERNTNGMQEQIDVLGHLAGYLDIGYGAGSITVLLNSRIPVNDVTYLMTNATNSACVSCNLERLAQHDFNNLERESVAGTLERLNGTLREYKLKRAHEDGVPAKVVIYFHFDTNVNEDEDKLNDARVQLFYGHREVQIFAVGNGEILEKIATDMNTKFSEPMSAESRAHRLREEISRVPGALQYEECHERRYKGEANHVYNGYVTPDEKQLWAMYPEYFLKSYSIEFKFRAETGKLRVCFDRGVVDPSAVNDNDKDKCKNIDQPGGEVIFNIYNPCDRKTVRNCEPFNFAVIGVPTENTIGMQCNAHNCRRFDQIKYTITHKGVSCNGVLGLLASPTLLLAALYAVIRNV